MDLKKASFQILRLSFPVKAHFYNGFLHMGWLSFLSCRYSNRFCCRYDKTCHNDDLP